MKTVILYASKTPAEDRQPVKCGEDGIIYIRAQLAIGCSVEKALDLAKPEADEVVLNSVECAEVEYDF